MNTFSSKYGNVNYSVVKLAGCCGVAVVYNVSFFHSKNKPKQFEDFNKHLLTTMHLFNLARPKILMADKVGGVIYDFCVHNNWLQGTPVENPKSGNEVITFEENRAPDKVRLV